MSSAPEKMRTGYPHPNNADYNIPQIYRIVILILHAILRRNGLADCILYNRHNSRGTYDFQLWESGVAFNLLSYMGVADKLKPLVQDLFSTLSLDPDKYKDDPFYAEIVKYTPYVSQLIDANDFNEEFKWLTSYALANKDLLDPVYIEREERLTPFIASEESSEMFPLNFISAEEIVDCQCSFCLEFRTFAQHPPQNAMNLVNQALSNIAERVYLQQIL